MHKNGEKYYYRIISLKNENEAIIYSFIISFQINLAYLCFCRRGLLQRNCMEPFLFVYI